MKWDQAGQFRRGISTHLNDEITGAKLEEADNEKKNRGTIYCSGSVNSIN